VSLICPVCAQADVHHSRFRSWRDRLRWRITGRVPYRCHQCDWRGWRHDTSRTGDGPREIHRQLTDVELEHLDPGAKTDPQ
jgi:hypothetical protein